MFHPVDLAKAFHTCRDGGNYVLVVYLYSFCKVRQPGKMFSVQAKERSTYHLVIQKSVTIRLTSVCMSEGIEQTQQERAEKEV